MASQYIGTITRKRGVLNIIKVTGNTAKGATVYYQHGNDGKGSCAWASFEHYFGRTAANQLAPMIPGTPEWVAAVAP